MEAEEEEGDDALLLSDHGDVFGGGGEVRKSECGIKDLKDKPGKNEITMLSRKHRISSFFEPMMNQ